MGLKFFQVDVFTDRIFGGNPLAVFPEPGKLDETVFLQIAREMNLSETTFVYPPNNSKADFRIRIFTPGKEIPFAGHPTLGTAHILWETGKAEGDSIVLEMEAGLFNVTKKQKKLFMEQPLASFWDTVKSVDQVAEALSIDPSEVDSRFPLQIVSTGFPALYVPLTNLESLQRIELNLSILKEVLGSVDMIYGFTRETLDSRSTVHSRAFAPFLGIPEDPATGSAAGALGAYLVSHNFIENLDPSTIVIEQGFEINRPSTIQVCVGTTGKDINSIQVGGQVITVLDGSLRK